jgi:hypothetical protein
LVILLLLTVTMARLNQKLAVQIQVDDVTLRGADTMVAVTDRLTLRLAQLTRLTGTADHALAETQALQPLLLQLQQAIGPAARAIATGRAGGESSRADLSRIRTIVDQLQRAVLPLVPSARAFGDQGKQLLTILRGVNDDLDRSVEDARRINDAIPIPDLVNTRSPRR